MDRPSPPSAYEHILHKLAGEDCIVLDGGIGTELQRQGVEDFRLSDSSHWGFDAVAYAPQAVADVHKQYIRAGCDVVTTDTYAVLSAPDNAGGIKQSQPAHWMDMARKGVLLARDAVKTCGRQSECAVAFSIGGDVVSDRQLATVRLLLRVFDETPPDLVLLETLTMMADSNTRAAVELLVESGIPVWLSFRRCRQGVCGIHGQLWGGPEGGLVRKPEPARFRQVWS